MSQSVKPIQQQRGAVAIIVGITIGLLIVIVGLVVDLGYLYTRKTELQNAADAAALAGAKELNGTDTGIQAAAAKAIAMAALNNVDYGGTPVAITNANIGFGNMPDDCIPLSKPACLSVGAANNTTSKGKFFITVDTQDIQQGIHPTWFMRVAGFESTSTYGRAVAGPYVVDIAPLGVCAVDKTQPEMGFIRGVAYNLLALNPLGINADPLWINPVNAPPDDCADVDPQWNSTAKMTPFVCTGKSIALSIKVSNQVFVNTGTSAALEKALNSRFDDQGSGCDVTTAPPDSNVKQYPATGLPRDWMQPDANTLPCDPNAKKSALPCQGIYIDPATHKPIAKTVDGAIRSNTVPPDQYGVLWSYAKEKNFSTGADHSLGDWQALYGLSADQTSNGYPTTGTPYTQTSGKYFSPPPNNPPGVAGRRILNLAIIDCDAGVAQLGSGNKCAALTVLSIGKFFMTVEADLPKELFMEFGGVISPPSLDPEIRLYR